MVVVVFGLPGSGKSFFAERLSKELDAEYISSDRIRNELFSSKTYTAQEKQAVYKMMLQRAIEVLNNKRDVVIDATFYKKEYRDVFKTLSGPVDFIEVVADKNIIKERLAKPRLHSDADFNVYKKIRTEWEPMTEDHVILESSNRNLESMINKTLRYLKHDKR